MAKAGDSYVVELRENHLAWGTYRYTASRTPRSGEAYLPIPIEYARKYEIYNGNATHKADVLGENIFGCVTIGAYLKAQGGADRGAVYAKQFAVNDDLKGLGEWYRAVGAKPGDSVRVVWISPSDIEIELL